MLRAMREEDVADVRCLPSKVEAGYSSTGLSRLSTSNKSRQLRHDAALDGFRDKVVAVADHLEERVINAGRDLKDELERFDEKIAAVMARLGDDGHLRMQEYEYVVGSWQELEGLCAERKGAVEAFHCDMEGIEESRGSEVGTELRKLLNMLVKIGYILKGEVERLVENEAHELNVVMIDNMRAQADVYARLMKKQVGVYYATREGWEEREVAWRHLRHKRAVQQFTTTLNSRAFTNPSARIDILARMRAGQLDRHRSTRLALLHELGSLVPPSLTEKAVADVRGRFAALATEENSANASFFQSLKDQTRDMMLDAKALREELRAELHTFAALAPDGDLYTGGDRGSGRRHRPQLEGMIGDTELDDFFRKAGGLKSELANVVRALATPSLIYGEELLALRVRVKLLVGACKVDSVLAVQGKSDSRKAVSETLETLRTAKKADIPPVVPVLFHQTAALAGVTGLEADVYEELEAALAQLQNVLPGLHLASRRAPTPDAGSSGEENKTGGADGAAVADGGEDGSGGGAREHVPALALGTSDAATNGGQLNLIELRAAQKRLGTLVHASSLRQSCKDELGALHVTLERQIRANRAVDEATERAAALLIAARKAEATRLVRLVGLALQAQSAALHEGAKNVCAFYSHAAKIYQKNEDAQKITDENLEDALDKLFDTFEDENASREGEMDRVVDSLRHAPHMLALEGNMKCALEQLETIERGYRNYHEDAIQIIEAHPRRVVAEAGAYQGRVSAHFALIIPEEAARLIIEAEEKRRREEQEAANEKERKRKEMQRRREEAARKAAEEEAAAAAAAANVESGVEEDTGAAAETDAVAAAAEMGEGKTAAEAAAAVTAEAEGEMEADADARAREGGPATHAEEGEMSPRDSEMSSSPRGDGGAAERQAARLRAANALPFSIGSAVPVNTSAGNEYRERIPINKLALMVVDPQASFEDDKMSIGGESAVDSKSGETKAASTGAASATVAGEHADAEVAVVTGSSPQGPAGSEREYAREALPHAVAAETGAGDLGVEGVEWDPSVLDDDPRNDVRCDVDDGEFVASKDEQGEIAADEDDVKCVEALAVPIDGVATHMALLRETLLDLLDLNMGNRADWSQEQCEERRTEYTDELEERLREQLTL